MCKVLVITGLKPDNVNNNWQFIEEMGRLMSRVNDDGLGYTAVDEKGNLFGERWLFNDDAFDVRSNSPKLLKKYFGFLEGEEHIQSYGKFGNYTDRIVAITLHTRFATSPKGFANVHPFVDLDNQVSVIHNGSIRNHTKDDEIRSTCDSERILNVYLQHNMKNNPANIQRMVDDLKGNFACGIMVKGEDGKPFVDVFRSRAQLSAGYIKQLGALVITTDFDDVKNVAKDLGFTIANKYGVKEDKLVRIDAITGKPIVGFEYKDTANQYVYNSTTNTTSTYTGGTQSHSSAHGNYTPANRSMIPVTEKDTTTEEVDVDVNKVLTETEWDRVKNRIMNKSGAVTQGEIEQARAIGLKHGLTVVDKLNEDAAAMNGWHFDKESGIWLKRVRTNH